MGGGALVQGKSRDHTIYWSTMKKDPFLKYREFFTDPVFLIGNGSSRKDFDLNTLVGKGTIIGCNALYRDFVPDILICHDSRMLQEVLKSRYPGLVLTDKGHGYLPNKVVYRIKDARTSGAYGLRFISEVIQPSECFVLGLDGYPGNVYQGTENYSDPTFKYYHSISEQYTRIIEKSNTKFIQVQDRATWNVESDNFEIITYGEFNSAVECRSYKSEASGSIPLTPTK